MIAADCLCEYARHGHHERADCPVRFKEEHRPPTRERMLAFKRGEIPMPPNATVLDMALVAPIVWNTADGAHAFFRLR